MTEQALSPQHPMSLSGVQRLWPGAGGAATSGALVGAAGAGAMAAVLLPGNPAGLGLALTGAAVGAASVPSLRRHRRWADLGGVVLAVALLGVGAVRDAGWLVWLCALAGVLVAVVALTGARSWVAVALSGPASALGAALAGVWVGRGAAVVTRGRGPSAWPVLRSGGVAVALLAVFGLLFASADAVFASLAPDLDLRLAPVRAVALVVGAAAALVVAHLAGAVPRWRALDVRSGRPVRLVEWLVPLVALDGLVVTFVAVQVGALLGGHRHLLATTGLTYAEYARQGFAQLVAATALTLAVVAVAVRYAPRASVRDRVATSAALAVLCLSTLGVVASALRRLDLYVDAFGLTRLRLLAGVGELTLGAVLVLVLVAGVRWRGAWLPRSVVATLALAMLLLAGANPDAVIAERNIERYRAGTRIDIDYLAGMSADAVGVLDALPEPLRSCTLRGTGVDAGAVGGWNLGRARAADVLDARPALTVECPESGTMPR